MEKRLRERIQRAIDENLERVESCRAFKDAEGVGIHLERASCYKAALSFLNIEASKEEAARAVMLSELNHPRPGLRVEGEGPLGKFAIFFAEYVSPDPEGGSYFAWWTGSDPEDSETWDYFFADHEDSKLLIAALVSSGAAVVTGLEEEKPSKDDGIAGAAVVVSPGEVA